MNFRIDFSEFQNAADDIKHAVRHFSDSMYYITKGLEGLSSELSGISDKLYDIDGDLKGTKDHIQKGFDLLAFASGDIKDDPGDIAGAVAIEYSKDPEDDIEKPATLNFTYCTKTVIHSCVTDCKITGKKNCTGGVAGLAEIGTIYMCENYAKSSVSGKKYVGGIAGQSDTVTSCCTIVKVIGEENAGAVCGIAGSLDKLYGNFFADSDIGAADGISYSRKAVPAEFEVIKNINKVPKRFISFTVTFIADDKVVKNEEIKYGESTKRIKYPAVPEKRGSLWKMVRN